MTRRAHAATAQLYLRGLAPVPPAPTSGTRERPFVVCLRGGFELDAPGLGMWPTGEPAVVEVDPGAAARVMERRRERVDADMRRRGKAAPAPQETNAKADNRLCGGGKPRRRT